MTRFFIIVIYLVDEGKEDPNTTVRVSLSRQRNVISMTFRWPANDGPKLNAGLVACDFSGDPISIAKKPYIFVFVRGCPEPLPPS